MIDPGAGGVLQSENIEKGGIVPHACWRARIVVEGLLPVLSERGASVPVAMIS